MNKICSKCKGEFPATTEYWHRNKSAKDGLNSWCKTCHRATAQKLVTDPNTGEVIKAGALSKRKLVTDPTTGETISAGLVSKRKRRATEEGREKSRAANRASCKKRWANGKTQEYMVGYLESNPLAKLRQRMSSLIHASMKAKGWSKSTKTQQLLGCDFDFLLSHLKQSLPTYVDYDVVHIDHIICCSSAENEDELNALQHYSNLQWLPGPENLSKSDSLPPDWKERQAKLMKIYWSRFPERRKGEP